LRAADPICCRQGGPALSGAGEEVKIALEIGDNFAIIKYRTTIENNNKLNKILYENK